MSQIAGKCTDIFRNGHLVVVQDHKKVVQLFNVVHALVDHAAGKGTIADHRDHKPCFMMQLFGPRHADRKRKRRVSVPGNECIVFTRLGSGNRRSRRADAAYQTVRADP